MKIDLYLDEDEMKVDDIVNKINESTFLFLAFNC